MFCSLQTRSLGQVSPGAGGGIKSPRSFAASPSGSTRSQITSPEPHLHPLGASRPEISTQKSLQKISILQFNCLALFLP